MVITEDGRSIGRGERAQYRLIHREVFQSTDSGDCIAIGRPQCQRFLEAAQYGLLLSVCRGMIDDHVIGIMAVARFDHLVGANQVHGIGGRP